MSNAEKPAAKFTLKLTREMRLALVVLGFAGALGGWFVYNTSQAPTTVDLTEEPITAAPVTPGDSSAAVTVPVEAEPEGSVDVTAPSRPVQAPDLPFLTDSAPVPQAPTEASPEITLAPRVRAQALPNPFRPLTLPTPEAEVVAVAAPARTPVAQPAAQPIAAATVTPVPVRPPQISTLGGPTIPNVAGPVTVRPPSISGVMPLPVVPGAGAPVLAPGTTFQVPQVPQAPQVRTPPSVPTPSVRAPSRSALAVSTPAREGTSGARFQPATPEVLRALQVQATTTVTDPDPAPEAEPVVDVPEVQQPINQLDAYVADQQVRYSAVVLGPVNTGIFQTKTGYVVVTLGQQLPDSEIVVRDISSTSVTLGLGEQLKTLEIDKR